MSSRILLTLQIHDRTILIQACKELNLNPKVSGENINVYGLTIKKSAHGYQLIGTLMQKPIVNKIAEKYKTMYNEFVEKQKAVESMQRKLMKKKLNIKSKLQQLAELGSDSVEESQEELENELSSTENEMISSLTLDEIEITDEQIQFKLNTERKIIEKIKQKNLPMRIVRTNNQIKIIAYHS